MKNNKEDFINTLGSLSPQEINQMIKDKGKKPKLIMPIWFEEE